MQGKLAATVTAAFLTTCALCNDFQKTYSTCDDFDEGTYQGAVCFPDEGDGAVGLTPEVVTLPIMWIANAGEDTVSKWDTDPPGLEEGREVARYHTWFGPRANHSELSGPAPSRTAVDLDGNVFVANRHFDGRPAQVIKILNEGFIDRNGNGVADTCTDLNGDCVIDDAELAPYRHTDLNGNGIFEDNEIGDEKIAWIKQVGPANGLGRCLAIDVNGDIWVGLYNAVQFWKMDGNNGNVLLGPFNSACRPYGAFVDRDGILWAATLGGCLIKFDTNPGQEGLLTIIGAPNNYGIVGTRRNPDGLGERTIVITGGSTGYREYDSLTGAWTSPSGGNAIFSYAVSLDGSGNILAGEIGTNSRARKYAPSGAMLWSTIGAVAANRATIADSNGDAWRISVGQSLMQKLDGQTGAVLPGGPKFPNSVFPTGRRPYTYSDATGLGLRTSFPQGFWRVTYDSGCVDTCWDQLTWDETLPSVTEINLRVRSSVDGVNFSAWEDATNGTDFAAIPNGRYLNIEAEFQVLSGDDSPLLNSLTIHGADPMVTVLVDPRRDPNRVFLSRNYSIPVFCYGNDKVDVSQLDWTTARFGPTGIEAAPYRAPGYADFNNDGYMDGAFLFRTFDCNFQLGDTQGWFSIDSVGGCEMTHSDSVQVFP